MSDFPEHVFIGRNDDICVLEIEEDADFIDVYDSSQQYIRSDLVPQWQPIETVPINTPVLAVVRNEPEYGRVAIVGSSFPDKLKLHYSNWMPIPKVPG